MKNMKFKSSVRSSKYIIHIKRVWLKLNVKKMKNSEHSKKGIEKTRV